MDEPGQTSPAEPTGSHSVQDTPQVGDVARTADATAEPRRDPKLVALLILLTTLPPVAITTFLPSLPSIAEEFETNEAVIQLGVTLFLFAFALSHLLLGPASDKYGRRPTLLTGLLIFLVGSVMALVATGPALFVTGRIVQGFGAASGPALGRAIIIDVYGPRRSTRLLAYAIVATAFAPLVAPVIGGIIEESLGWRYVFALLVAFAVLLLIASLGTVRETNVNRDPEALRLSRMTSNYAALLRHRHFLAYALLLGLLFSGQVAFLATSSFILIDVMGLTPTIYGVTFMAVAAGVMMGAFLASRLDDVTMGPGIVVVGAGIAAVATAVMAGIGVVGSVGLWAVLVPVFVRGLGSGLLRPAAIAGALLPFKGELYT